MCSKIAKLINISEEYKIYSPITILPFIPIVIGLYYFYYRIQRSVSESCILRLNITFIKFIFLCFLFFSYIRIGAIGYSITLYDFVVILISVIWLFYFVKQVFESLNIEYLLRNNLRNLKQMLRLFDILNSRFFYRFAYVKIDLYRELEWNFDILYQIIEHSINKSVDTVYLEMLESIEEVLRSVSNILVKESDGVVNIDNLKKLAKFNDVKESDACVSLFRNLMRNHKKICIILYENYRNNDYDVMWRILLDCYPQQQSSNDMDDKLQRTINEFFKVYWSMAVYFAERDRDKLLGVLQGINKFVRYRPERINHILLLRALIVHAIDKNNISLLTEICYLQEIIIDKIKEIDKDEMFNTEQNQNEQFSRMISKELIKNKDATRIYQGMNLYVLFQAAIKATELGQYNIIGFLAKYIVSHYTSYEIYKVGEKIIRNRITKDKKLENEPFYNRLNVKFNINEKNAGYFFKKWIIILRIQQNFRYKDADTKIPFNIISEKEVDSTEATFNIEYCLEKVLHVGKDYGLLSVVKYSEKMEGMFSDKEEDKLKKELANSFY